MGLPGLNVSPDFRTIILPVRAKPLCQEYLLALDDLMMNINAVKGKRNIDQIGKIETGGDRDQAYS